jgi:hypothetical protein
MRYIYLIKKKILLIFLSQFLFDINLRPIDF